MRVRGAKRATIHVGTESRRLKTKDEFLAVMSEYVVNEDYRGALRFASLHYPDLQRRLTPDEDL